MQPEQLNRRIVRLAVSFCACILSLAVSLALSYAWVSKNLKVANDSKSFSIDPDLLNALNSSGDYIFIDEDDSEFNVNPSGYLPGSSGDFYIGLFNKSGHEITINELGIAAPVVWTTSSSTAFNNTYSTDFDEVPVLYEGNYYYLGQSVTVYIKQIDIYSATYESSTNKVTLGTWQSSVSNIPQTPVYLLDGDPSEVPTGSKLLSGVDFTIGNNQAARIKVCITFPNTNADQNMFKNFGFAPTSTHKISYGYCHRLLYAVFSSSLLPDESGS